MDAVLQKFAGKIDAQSLVKCSFVYDGPICLNCQV